VPRHTSTPQTTTEAALPTIRPSGTVTQRVYTTSDQHDATTPHSQTFMLGRLNWRELIEEGLR